MAKRQVALKTHVIQGGTWLSVIKTKLKQLKESIR
jgi:hypothetical protein